MDNAMSVLDLRDLPEDAIISIIARAENEATVQGMCEAFLSPQQSDVREEAIRQFAINGNASVSLRLDDVPVDSGRWPHPGESWTAWLQRHRRRFATPLRLRSAPVCPPAPSRYRSLGSVPEEEQVGGLEAAAAYRSLACC